MEEKTYPYFIADDPLKRIKFNLLGYGVDVKNGREGWVEITTNIFDDAYDPIIILCAEVDVGCEYFLSDAGQFMNIIYAAELDTISRKKILEVLEERYTKEGGEFRIEVYKQSELPNLVKEMALAIARVSHALKPSSFLRDLNKVLDSV